MNLGTDSNSVKVMFVQRLLLTQSSLSQRMPSLDASEMEIRRWDWVALGNQHCELQRK